MHKKGGPYHTYLVPKKWKESHVHITVAPMVIARGSLFYSYLGGIFFTLSLFQVFVGVRSRDEDAKPFCDGGAAEMAVHDV